MTSLSQLTARYPTHKEQQDMQFAITDIGRLRDCKFYISSPGYEKSGLAFRVAYDAAKQSSNHKDLCAYVGSMICAVSKDLQTSVLEALNEVGVEPRFVELPSEARAHNKNEDHFIVAEMDWPLILVNFGLICILLFIEKNSVEDYKSFMSSCISELRNRAGHGPRIEFNAPFDFNKANAIRTMLGASLTLRASVIKLIMGNLNQERLAGVSSVCQYLFKILSWSGMDELIFLNKKLVIPQSVFLQYPQHSREAENLREAIAAIEAHPYPQFFMHLASYVELMKVDLSRFPSLVKMAKNM